MYFYCTPTHISLFTRIMWLPFSQGPFVISKLIEVELSFQYIYIGLKENKYAVKIIKNFIRYYFDVMKITFNVWIGLNS